MLTEWKLFDSLYNPHIFNTAASNNWNFSNTLWGKKVELNVHLQMFTALPVGDPIQEKPLEDEHFNLKTLITVWYKHISPQASNRIQ